MKKRRKVRIDGRRGEEMYHICSNYWNTIIKLKCSPFRQRSCLGVWSVSLLGGGQTFQSKEWRRRRRVRGRTKSCRVRCRGEGEGRYCVW